MIIKCTKANPALIKWCRAEGGFTIQAVAERLGIKDAQYTVLENGDDFPTLGQLRKLAEHYKRPLGIFFLPKPPNNLKKPKDFRGNNGDPTPKLLRSIRRARFIQSNLKLFVRPENPKMWPPVNVPSSDAGFARTWLGLTDLEQTKNRNVSAFYRHLVALLEQKNISLLQHSFLSEEAKAYSFAENPKIIVVSTNDQYIGSRIFSLVHELCHLSHGQSGICLPNSENTDYSKERLCDRFAAEFLMPERLVRPLIEGKSKELLLDDDFLRATADTLKTSMYALVIRLREFGAINHNDVNVKKTAWSKIPRRKTGFATTTRAQKTIKENGHTFTEAVIGAYNNNLITVSDASYYLNINQSYINEVGEKVTVA